MTRRSFRGFLTAARLAVLLLIPALLLGAAPVSAAAEEPGLSLRKYVEKVPGDNDAYDLTLSFRGDASLSSPGRADLLFLVDTTGSMNGILSDGVRAWDGITRSVSAVTGALAERGVDARYAMLRFWSYQSNYPPEAPWQDCEVRQGWTADAGAILSELDVLSSQLDNATNYDAAFYTLGTCGLLESAREDADVLVFFLSDGDPNIYYDADGYDVPDENFVNGRYPDSEEAGRRRLAGVAGMDGFFAVGVGGLVGLDMLRSLAGVAAAGTADAYLCTSGEAPEEALLSVVQSEIHARTERITVTDTLSENAVPAPEETAPPTDAPADPTDAPAPTPTPLAPSPQPSPEPPSGVPRTEDAHGADVWLLLLLLSVCAFPLVLCSGRDGDRRSR